MTYDYASKTLFITYKELINLIRIGELTNHYQTDSEKVHRIKVED